MAAAKKKAAGAMLFLAPLVLAGGMVAYHALAGQPSKPEPPPGKHNAGAGVEKYGSAAGARNHAREVFNAIRGSHRGCELWHPGAFEATLDRETHQWTVTGDVRADSWVQKSAAEKKFRVVARYNPSSRSYEAISNSWQSSWPPGPEKGWSQVHMNELGKWVQGKFIKPMHSTAPVSSLLLVSNRTFPFFQRGSYSYPGSGLIVQKRQNGLPVRDLARRPPRGVIVRVNDNGADVPREWTLEFGGPYGRFLEVGEYGGATASDVYDRTYSPFLGIEMKREIHRIGVTGGGLSGGEFVVWEIEAKDEKIMRLAIDFIWDGNYGLPREPNGPHRMIVYGSLRVNSQFQTALPVPGPEAAE
jgi:hypothetical protein